MSPRWLLLGSLIVWLTLLAPAILVIAWLNSWHVTFPLFLAALLSPVLMVIVMREFQSSNSRSKWYWMQYLGLGALLLPIVITGLVLRMFLDAPTVGLLALAAWAVIIPIAWRSANTIHNKHLSIESAMLNSSVRLVHISDMHVGSRSANYLEKVVKQVLGHQPDIVVITGDLLDQSSVDAEQLANLSKIECPTLMCLGNHERYVDLDAAIIAIETNQVQILRDSATTIDQVRFIGIDDRDTPDALPAILTGLGKDHTRFNVALYHRPDGWQAIQQHDYDLTLAGHTHAGQIWPFSYLVKSKYPQMVGWFENGARALYVSPGAGTWGPIFRLGTKCEMTIIDLKAQPTTAINAMGSKSDAQ